MKKNKKKKISDELMEKINLVKELIHDYRKNEPRKHFDNEMSEVIADIRTQTKGTVTIHKLAKLIGISTATITQSLVNFSPKDSADKTDKTENIETPEEKHNIKYEEKCYDPLDLFQLIPKENIPEEKKEQIEEQIKEQKLDLRITFEKGFTIEIFS